MLAEWGGGGVEHGKFGELNESRWSLSTQGLGVTEIP